MIKFIKEFLNYQPSPRALLAFIFIMTFAISAFTWIVRNVNVQISLK